MQVCMSEEKINKLEITMTKFEGSINLLTEIVKRIEDKLDTHVTREEEPSNKPENRFAPKSLEKKVEDIVVLMNQRQYEWLKWSLITLFTVITTIFIYNKFKL